MNWGVMEAYKIMHSIGEREGVLLGASCQTYTVVEMGRNFGGRLRGAPTMSCSTSKVLERSQLLIYRGMIEGEQMSRDFCYSRSRYVSGRSAKVLLLNLFSKDLSQEGAFGSAGGQLRNVPTGICKCLGCSQGFPKRWHVDCNPIQIPLLDPVGLPFE